MTVLSLAVRNTLAQDEALKTLLGKSVTWDTWIFDERPVNVTVEKTSKCMIVVNEIRPWTQSNDHNSMTFPTIVIDIWADPTRNTGADKSVRLFDAKAKIKLIEKYVDKHLKTIDMADRFGLPIIWGTPAQIANKTGVVIAASQKLTGPDFEPVNGTDGAWMASYTYGVNQVS